MENMFGTKIRNFAFPYGDHDEAVIELCREAGYKHVYTNVPNTLDPSLGEFVRGRVSVDPADGLLEFYLKMSGAYAWMAQASALKKWLRTRQRRKLQPQVS